MSDADRPAIEDRGELTLTLGGAVMGLRPTYEAIDGMEKATGRGVMDLARAALARTLSLGELAQVATEAVRAWGRENESKDASGANVPRVAKLILSSDGGIQEAMKVVSAMLSLAVTGGYDAEGNLKPAATTTTTDEAPVAG